MEMALQEVRTGENESLQLSCSRINLYSLISLFKNFLPNISVPNGTVFSGKYTIQAILTVVNTNTDNAVGFKWRNAGNRGMHTQ